LQASEKWYTVSQLKLKRVNHGKVVREKATCFGSEAPNLKAKGAIYTGKPVERDGSIITANGPESASLFGEAIAIYLA